jgi:hypothetical protein
MGLPLDDTAPGTVGSTAASPCIVTPPRLHLRTQDTTLNRRPSFKGSCLTCLSLTRRGDALFFQCGLGMGKGFDLRVLLYDSCRGRCQVQRALSRREPDCRSDRSTMGGFRPPISELTQYTLSLMVGGNDLNDMVCTPLADTYAALKLMWSSATCGDF